MADEHDLVTVALVALGLVMHFGDERAGGVDDGQGAEFGFVFDLLRDAVGAENGDAAFRNFLDFADENHAFLAEGFDDPAVMDDLMPHINRRTVKLQRTFDDVDGAVHARAEPAGRGEVDGEGGDGHTGYLAALGEGHK